MKKLGKIFKWLAIGGLSLVVLIVVAALLLVDFDSFGGSAEGDRLARIINSPNYVDDQFVNNVPTDLSFDSAMWSSTKDYFLDADKRRPAQPLPSISSNLTNIADDRSRTKVVWLGHATALVALEGVTLLIDPVFDENVGSVAGFTERFQPTPVAREDLPPVDAIIISHDHYDHLEQSSVEYFANRGTIFFVPLGVGAHLEEWNVADSLIVELDWWEAATLRTLEITCTPARHFSGRSPFDRNQTLWASWVIVGTEQRIYYSGDTGYMDQFAEIGERFGPFDLTIMSLGAYGDAWPDIHVFPEEVTDAHLALKGDILLPVHWGTFDLALHTWDDPIIRLAKAVDANGVNLCTPHLGEIIDLHSPTATVRWWEAAR